MNKELSQRYIPYFETTRSHVIVILKGNAV
jgi:hypothetical protein